MAINIKVISKIKKLSTMSWNWLLKVKVLSLPSILSNLKSAASLFLRGLLGTVDSTLLIQTLSIA